MTEGILPDRGLSIDSGDVRFRISRSAIQSNVRTAAAAMPGGVADLRRDARGHGVDLVGAALLDAGITRAVVDPADAPAMRRRGFDVVDVVPTLDAGLVIGLPGTGGTPAGSMVSAIASTKILRAGEGVSYGYTHRATADTRIALVPGGYANGVVRKLGNAAEVSIGGTRHRIIGRVAMDVFVIDLGESPAAPGDEVVLFGDPARDEPSLAEWVGITGMTAGELALAAAVRVRHEVIA